MSSKAIIIPTFIVIAISTIWVTADKLYSSGKNLVRSIKTAYTVVSKLNSSHKTELDINKKMLENNKDKGLDNGKILGNSNDKELDNKNIALQCEK